MTASARSTATARLNAPSLIAWGTLAAAVALALAYPVLYLMVAGEPLKIFALPGVETVNSVVAASIGALVVSRLPRHPVGWLLLGEGFFIGLNGTGALYAIYATFVQPQTAPLGVFAGWLSGWDYIPNIACLSLTILLFPDGRLPSPRWRAAAVFIVVAAIAWVLLAAVVQPAMGITFIDHSGQMGGLSATKNPTYDLLYA
ncbi:MAG: hypothetical protein M3O87_00730, partial [Candidatus Dormibacteraeota bacterium]|nr:hypothetical protein [Candidatus Dormibacteraeota bacterium]